MSENNYRARNGIAPQIGLQGQQQGSVGRLRWVGSRRCQVWLTTCFVTATR